MASTLNTTCLDNILCSRLESTRVDNSSESLATRALAAPLRSTDRAVSVATVNDLPDLYNSQIEDGQLIYVESINVPVIASFCQWIGLDQRLLRSDQCNTLWTWGWNGNGNLGDGTTTSKSSPVSVMGGFTDWCQVSVSCSFTSAIKQDGTIWTWGSSTSGQLGDNTGTAKCSPVSVVGGFTWCQISAGSSHALAIRNDGTAWSWGFGNGGILGDGTTVNKSSPVSVLGGFTDWCQVSAGYIHSAAVRTNGTLWAWGCGSYGQLGDGTTICKSSPVSVLGGFTNWCQVAAGYRHTAAIRTTGEIYTWGCNCVGQLGDSSTTNRSSPVAAVGGYTWCYVDAGHRYTIAIRNNGTLWAWGHDGSGQLGDGQTTCKSSPVSVIGGYTDWCKVSAGCLTTAAIRTNGEIWTWGSASFGLLGNNCTTNCSSPVSIIGGITSWCQVNITGRTVAAIRI